MKHATHLLTLIVTLSGCSLNTLEHADTESGELLPCELEGTGFPRAWRFSFELVEHEGCIIPPEQSDLLVTQVSGPAFPDLTGSLLNCEPAEMVYVPSECVARHEERCTLIYGGSTVEIVQNMEHGGNNFVFGTVEAEIIGTTSTCRYTHNMFGVILDQ